jgi:lipoate---protein ligase
MRFLDLTLPTPAENLALDEALLDDAEAAGPPAEVLRLWEPSRPLVVVGCSSQVQLEVELNVCRRNDVPVLRRASGGAAIVAGPGCLMYAVVLSYERRPLLRSLTEAHRFVLDTLIAGLSQFSTAIERLGTCDLVLGDRKFSGNSVRCKRSHLLYHGTLLYDFALADVGRYLSVPPRQPDYRAGRSHDSFVTNLAVGAADLRWALRRAWQADEPLPSWPARRTADLAANKYSRDDWNLRR